MSENILNNNALASLARNAAPQVVRAIKEASARTGVNFAYLMKQAAAESGFDARAEAGTSSAAGLYQFIEKTWIRMVKKHGAEYGMGDLAAKIDDQGRISDPEARKKILDLRKNPEKAAMLAAEFASENRKYLQAHVDGEIGSTELYFAHFMGASGAAGFLNAMKENPLQTAADLFPKEARANYNVFYDRKTGEARTLAGVYDFFAKKFGGNEASPPAAPAAPVPPRAAPPAATPFFAPGQNFLNLTVSRLLNQEKNSDWNGVLPAGSSNDLIFNPAELMLLANRTLPTDYRNGPPKY